MIEEREREGESEITIERVAGLTARKDERREKSQMHNAQLQQPK